MNFKFGVIPVFTEKDRSSLNGEMIIMVTEYCIALNYPKNFGMITEPGLLLFRGWSGNLGYC